MVEDNGIEEDARALMAFAETYLNSHISAIGGLRPRLVRGGDAPAEMVGDVASYPQMPAVDQVLLIVNDTPSRSRADKGAVVTTWGVHWKTTGGAGSRSWTELAQVSGEYGPLGSRIHIDDQTVLLRLLSQDEIGLFLGFVLLIAEGNTDVQPNGPRDPTPTLRQSGTVEKKQQPKAETARDKQQRKVVKAEEERARKRAALGIVDPQETTSEIADVLNKLGELHAAGVLTDAEFAEKKKELLRRK